MQAVADYWKLLVIYQAHKCDSGIVDSGIVDFAFSLLSGKAIAVTPRNQHIVTHIHIHKTL